MRQRFLITGGAGFLGINLIRFLARQGHTVTSLDIADFPYADVVGGCWGSSRNTPTGMRS